MSLNQLSVRSRACWLGQVVAHGTMPVDVAADDVLVDLVLPDWQAGRVDRELVALLGLAQRDFQLLLRANVEAHADKMQRAAGGIVGRDVAALVQPAPLAARGYGSDIRPRRNR